MPESSELATVTTLFVDSPAAYCATLNRPRTLFVDAATRFVNVQSTERFSALESATIDLFDVANKLFVHALGQDMHPLGKVATLSTMIEEEHRLRWIALRENTGGQFEHSPHTTGLAVEELRTAVLLGSGVIPLGSYKAILDADVAQIHAIAQDRYIQRHQGRA